MLKLRNITKSYKFGDRKRIVLEDINIDFKKGECVFILGKSGSGKSTLLNIIATLIEVDKGNIYLDNEDITKFNSRELCNYRNNMIGYIYQDYHLIEYMSLIDNVKLGSTISNSNKNIDYILKKLDLYDKKNILVNRLSGGEKQRVAIARVLVNNPEIILCDEPTGALDSVNGYIIMDILKELSREKLVIIVSHDENLANKYSDRIIRINDGKIVYEPIYSNNVFRDIRKNKIRTSSIFLLATKNLMLKKGRTIFTSIALSLGFLCLLLVLSLSISFNDVIKETEQDIVSIIPISVSNLDYEIMDNEIRKSDDKIIYKDKFSYIHTNKINKNYINYIKNINEISYISYNYDISLPLISDSYNILDNKYIRMLPDTRYIDNNYDILFGNNITSKNDILLKVDSNNNVSSDILDIFNINEDASYSDLIGRKIKVILNDSYYIKNGEYYYINDNKKKMYDGSQIILTIVGIVRELGVIDDNSCLYYHNDLIDYVIEKNKNSNIVLEQLKSDKLVINNFDNIELLLNYLGYNSLPNNINIYVNNLVNKEKVINKLDKYNDMYEDIIYVDNASETIKIIQDMINVISVILIIFSLISIMISSLMVFVLTGNRVIESIKEIGILRCLGASKRDIKRLFNIENVIISLMASLVGIVLIYLLKSPINYILSLILLEDNIFKIDGIVLFLCVIFNIFMVIISGYIPSRIASNKDIIDCMYHRF